MPFLCGIYTVSISLMAKKFIVKKKEKRRNPVTLVTMFYFKHGYRNLNALILIHVNVDVATMDGAINSG